ncbi:MAG: MBL fold metallo-hydrolase [Myxococcota bacterium]
MRVTILGSGSEGNATLFDTGCTRILIDAGLSLRQLRDRAAHAMNAALERLDAIVITHSHGDHVAHAARIAKAFGAPIYAQPETAEAAGLTANVYDANVSFRIGAIEVSPLRVPHDVPQVALVLRHQGDVVGLVTDLGHVPRALPKHLSGCRTVLLESNHDPELLAIAPYPVFVRARIGGSHGHLANAQTARLLKRLRKGPLERVVLMHLSQKANSPEKAYRIARQALGPEVELRVASQNTPMVLPSLQTRQLSFDYVS